MAASITHRIYAPSLRPQRPHWLFFGLAFGLVAVSATAAYGQETTETEPENYDEVANVRVLEREFLPAEKTRVEQLEMGYGVSAPDRLALAGEPPVQLLIRDTETGGATRNTAGLQANIDEELLDALEQVEQDIAAYDVSDAKLEKPFGLDVANEPAVQKYLALFTARGAKTVKVWIKRSGRWRDMVHQILDEEGVPRDLLYLAMIESGYRNTVKSPANAGGMWQFIPGTGHDQGLEISEYVDERFDPVKSTRAAARYLKKQYNRFESWPLAMAAYNGGGGLVRKSVKTYNTNDYFKLVEYGAMYEETRRYVPRIMAAALISKNMEAFGFEGLVVDDPWRFDEVDVPGGIRLSLLADAAGTDLETLEALNPELLKKETPPDRDKYTLRIPAGSSADFVAKFDDLGSRYGTDHERITLKFGETIENVASEIGVPARVVRQINGYSKRERAPYNSEIIVPTKGREEAKAASKSDDKAVVIVPADDFDLPDRQRVFYAVNKGDTMDEVAAFFGVRKVEVALWNDLDPGARLLKSMTLQLFVPADVSLDNAIVAKAEDVRTLVVGSDEWSAWNKKGKGKGKGKVRAYKVKRGDTVSKIAKKHNVTIKQIIRWNNLDKKATIRPGMRLIFR